LRDDKLVALCLQTEVEMPFFASRALLMGIGVFSEIKWRKVAVIWIPLSFEKMRCKPLLQTNSFYVSKGNAEIDFF
jgi:hypothetical protein